MPSTSSFSSPGRLPLPVARVILGPVTYASSGQGGELALAFQRQLRLDVDRIDGLAVIKPKPRNIQWRWPRRITRGIALHAEEGPAPSAAAPQLGSPAIQAIIDDAQAALEASYNLSGDRVLLDLTLKEAGTDKLLAAAEAVIPQAEIPPGLPLVPLAATPDIPQLKEAASREIHLQVASHLGDGQTFKEGDVISWFVSADRDAYLF